jgi:hypothetical protein
MTALRKYFPFLFVTITTLLIVGTPFFHRGYILTLDTVWGPTFPLTWSSEGINSTYLVQALIHMLSLAIPTWMVQKLFLFFVISALLYIPWKYLLYVSSPYAKVFSSLFFALNPFVYSRILAGQWFHLLGYALLPLVLHRLLSFTSSPTKKNTYLLTLSLLLVSLVSIHFLYLACIVTSTWVLIHLIKELTVGAKEKAAKLLFHSLLALVLFFVGSSYWIVPAMFRDTPLEARFDSTYYTTFAATSHDQIPVMMNVFALGGFWGEDTAWSHYFFWPQGILIFWIALFFVVVLSMIGMFTLLSKKESRLQASTFIALGVLSYITALGASNTPFYSFNTFLYNHIPLWGGLRDSHKIAGILGLIYAIFGGVGIERLVNMQEKEYRGSVGKLLPSVGIFTLILPAILGMYMWNGFHGQLNPVDYPKDWYSAKKSIEAMPENEKVLVLPWHGYLSLPFINNRIVANPSELFFGKNHVLVSRSVDFGPIYDQEVEHEYRSLDTLVQESNTMTEAEIRNELKKRNITKILFLTNSSIPKSGEGLTYWDEFYDNGEPKAEQRTWKELLPHSSVETFENADVVILTPTAY